MKKFELQKSPYVFLGSTVAQRAQTLDRIHQDLLQEHAETDIFFCDAQSLFYDFLNALQNVKLPQWRKSLLNKKYILIDGFHYFEQKKSILDDLLYIFKHTKAIVILTINKPIAKCNLGEEMQYILNAGTPNEISDEPYDCVIFCDIKKQWKETNYTPSAAKAAWFIKQDKSLTLEEKHKAWAEIITTMPDCAFDCSDIYEEATIDSVHNFISAYIELEKCLTEQFFKKESNAVYTYKFWSNEEKNWCGENGALYADFDEAKAEFIDDADLDPTFAQFSKRYIGAEDKRLHIRMRPDGAILSIAEDRFICDEQEHKIFYDVFFGMELAFKNKTEDEE